MVRALVLFACAVATLSCLGRRSPLPTGVVVITLDTTRADRLTAYGFQGAEMPHLDRLAREGVVFDQATSVGPLTLPAHASLFTGLWPAAHGVRENGAPALRFEHATLAEILRAHGYRAAAFVGSAVLNPDRGLSQGFEWYGGVAGGQGGARGAAQRNAETVVDEAIAWLKDVGDQRFFLWAHLYDPHRPYEPPEPFASRYAHDPYVGEIAYTDVHIGRLLDTLERQEQLGRTLVIVAGDHGESLGEHGERDHGIFVYESVLRVPLIIRAPAIEPRRVASVVRLVDVLPTALDLLGLPVPKTDGVSLTGAMNGKRPDLDAYAESVYPRRFGWSPIRSLRAGRFKLIDAPRPELYDLDRDPFEHHNIYSTRPETASAMGRRLSSFAGGQIWSELPDPRSELVPPDVRQRLATLGYVSQGLVGGPLERRSLRDAKDFIGQNWSPPQSPDVP
jgi:arylsulfatase A-like enzyme